MAPLDDLIEQMRSSPNDVRFADACKVANSFFGEPRQPGGSHRIWKMPWAGDPRVNLQESKGGTAKAYQVQQLLRAIDRYRAEQARRTEAGKAPAMESVPKKKQSHKRS
jgi:hypothetical protein